MVLKRGSAKVRQSMAGQPTSSQKTQAIIMLICQHRTFSGVKPKCAINDRSFSILFKHGKTLPVKLRRKFQGLFTIETAMISSNSASNSCCFTPTGFIENKACQVNIVLLFLLLNDCSFVLHKDDTLHLIISFLI